MKNIIASAASLAVSALLFVQSAVAEMTPDVLDLQKRWAVANYQLNGDEQIKAFEKLIDDADLALKNSGKNSEAWIWSGIIKSSFAGIKGGLGALSYAKASKAELEKALQIDDQALAGSAYTSLGTLYSKVPGWPIGFGSDKKARELLEKGLELNPAGIDSNYFYGEYWLDEGEWEKARQYLRKAQQAAPRPGREIADQGRQEQISQALATVRKKLKD